MTPEEADRYAVMVALGHLATIEDGVEMMHRAGESALNQRIYMRDTVAAVLRDLANAEVKLMRRCG